MAALRLPVRTGQNRPAALWGLAALVLVVHLLLVDGLVQQTQAGWGQGDKPPPAIDVAFVRELVAATPPARVVAVAPLSARLPAVAARPRPAASQAASAEPDIADQTQARTQARTQAQTPIETVDRPVAAPLAPDTALAVDSPLQAAPPEPVPPAQAAVDATPAVALAGAPDLAGAASFDWPPSTRMNYLLSGHYRGPVNGSAQVEWLREGSRYQVRMRTAIGPVLSRQIVSEGELTERGLVPRRFDGEQKVLFSAARRWSLRFTPERISLHDGREIDSLPGVQDEASQFVHLTWLFTTQPGLLQVGKSIELPLIVNRTLDRWTYDVVAEELLQFPFGSVPTFHVKPRREAKGSDLLAEIWFAPSLQYLPVRILIRQREDSYVDLTLERPPLQAAPAR